MHGFNFAIGAARGTLPRSPRFHLMTWGIAGLPGLNMLSGYSAQESGRTQLPLSTWVIPVVTFVILLLAVATALA